MDDVLRARIQIHILVDLRLLCAIEPLLWILDPILVEALEKPALNDGLGFEDKRKKRID